MLTMYDDTAVDLLPAADYFAGYVDGRFANIAAIKAKFPHATILSIAVFPADDADCLDVEPGDATRADIFGWFKRQQARGVARPCIYSSVSSIDGIVATMTANGFHRDAYRLWSAHYTGSPHVCSPSTCKLTSAQCDATQYTDHAMSRSLDESVLLPGFFGGAPKPAPKPDPAPDPKPDPQPSPEDDDMVELDTTVASHPLLLPYGTKTMDLLSVAPEGAPLVVEVTFLDNASDAKSYSLAWGTADSVGSGIEVPQGVKKARIDVSSGGGLPLSVRFNQ